MKTKNIFKVLSLAILMPAMLLTAACVNDEIPKEKGYELPVTINVTRQGDEARTKATYNGTSKKLEFSAGDKLYVRGYHYEALAFAGILDWQSGGIFSGTITTENEYTDTIDGLFTEDNVNAVLLPAGYKTYNYFYVENDGYNGLLFQIYNKAFATSKVTAVEQFSYENGEYVSETGFVLSPANAILNFTISGLTPTTTVAVVVSDGVHNMGGDVTTDGSGNATFAVGVYNKESKDITLTVNGTPITLNLFGGTNTELAAGKIYNVTRSVPIVKDLSTLTGDYTAQDGETLTGTLGNNYQVSIADGATVTLSDVTIVGYNGHPFDWAGITCQGDATIILKDGTTNSVQGFHENYPGLFVPVGKTLTIRGETAGTGILNASSTGNGPGIGGGYEIACGNIEIQGGYINATGAFGAAGIGSGQGASCGYITISGGTITATGGNVPSYEKGGAGIGSGHDGSSCGNITISDGTVNAYGGTCAAGIGCGHWSSCGSITISGGTIIAVGGNWAAGIGSGDGWTSDSSKTSSCGDITIKDTVTSVSATKGNNDVPDSIGAGFSGTCGTVTIQSGANVTQY